MRKPTISIEQFRQALVDMETDWKLAELAEREFLEYRTTSNGGQDDEESLDFARGLLESMWSIGAGEPEVAPARGRGERCYLFVGTMRNQPPIGTSEDPLCFLRKRLLRIPGVEEVAEPSYNPLLCGIWSVRVTIRLSQ